MSKVPLTELTNISDPASLSKPADDLPSPVPEVKDQGVEQQCSGGHDGYCSDENCTEVSEFAPDVPEPDMCQKCGKHGCRLKRCSRCKTVLYCSRECQKKDWQKHKKTCKIPDRVEDNLKDLLRDLTKTLAVGKAISLNEAKVKAEKLFPGRQLITDLADLDYFPTPGVFLGLISDMHIYVARHGIYITDCGGRQTMLFFYLDFDNPKPYFTWTDLKPGSYICIENPYMHVFLDGQVGMRIDDASSVRIVC